MIILVFDKYDLKFCCAQESANRQYKMLLKKFMNQNYSNGTTAEEYQASGESALINMYGKMFNLSKQKIGETDCNKVVKRDQNGHISKVNPCTS